MRSYLKMICFSHKVVVFGGIVVQYIFLLECFSLFLIFFSLIQFDGEPGEQAKEACAQFCNHQKFALEQLKVSEPSLSFMC